MYHSQPSGQPTTIINNYQTVEFKQSKINLVSASSRHQIEAQLSQRGSLAHGKVASCIMEEYEKVKIKHSLLIPVRGTAPQTQSNMTYTSVDQTQVMTPLTVLSAKAASAASMSQWPGQVQQKKRAAPKASQPYHMSCSQQAASLPISTAEHNVKLMNHIKRKNGSATRTLKAARQAAGGGQSSEAGTSESVAQASENQSNGSPRPMNVIARRQAALPKETRPGSRDGVLRI